MSALQKRVFQSGLPPRPPMSIGRGGLSAGRKKRDYSAVHWSKYFHNKLYVKLDNGDSFCVYEGGTKSTTDITIPVLVFLHGGGFSALTWAHLNSHLSRSVECRVFALDLRGHGDTTINASLDKKNGELDLRAEKLSDDISQVVSKLLGETTPPVVLVGHSMGGALAVHTALLGCTNNEDVPPDTLETRHSLDHPGIRNLVGICVIDVVEGTAMDALSSMQSFLRSRPKSFPSIDYAIEWAVRSGQVRNLDSARVSMPGQLKNMDTGVCSTQDVNAEAVELDTNIQEHMKIVQKNQASVDSIAEEAEEDDMSHSSTDEHQLCSSEKSLAYEKFKKLENENEIPSKKSSSYTWRVDLCKSEPHWTGWFSGLSSKFLSISASKLLVLAGVDRLDRDLTVGQMQGKFQMQILPQAGHAIHEDVPDKVADILATFLVRNKFAKPLSDFQKTFPAC